MIQDFSGDVVSGQITLKSPIGSNLSSATTRTLTPSKGNLAICQTDDKLYYGSTAGGWRSVIPTETLDAYAQAGGPAEPVTIGAFDNTSSTTGLGLTAQVLNLRAASQTNPGAVSTGAQTFGGVKTLTSAVLITPTIASIVNTGTLTVPTSTDTLIARATTDTLTNKTLTGTTNTIEASAFRTTGAAVVVSGAAAPSTNQVLQATSSTTATWQTLSGIGYTAVTPVAATDTNGLTINNSTNVITLENADRTHPGIVSIVAQTVSGLKTFADGIAPQLATAGEYSGIAHNITQYSDLNIGTTNLTGAITMTTSVAMTKFPGGLASIQFSQATQTGSPGGLITVVFNGALNVTTPGNLPPQWTSSGVGRFGMIHVMDNDIVLVGAFHENGFGLLTIGKGLDSNAALIPFTAAAGKYGIMDTCIFYWAGTSIM